MRKNTLPTLAIVSLLLISGLIGGLAPMQRDVELEFGSANAENSIMANGITKSKTIYLHNTTGSVYSLTDVLTMNTTMGQSQNLTDWENNDETFEWALNQTLAGNMSLEGDAIFYIWAAQIGGENDDEVITFNVTLYDVDQIDSPMIGSSEKTYIIRTVFTEYAVPIGLNHTLETEHTLRVVLTVSQSGANSDHSIGFGNSSYPSRLEIPTKDYIHPVSVSTLNYTYQQTTNFNASAANKTIHFNTTITDPFGGYDIWDVLLTLEGPNGTVLDEVSMNKIDGTYTSYYSNYSYTWNYSAAPEGEYTVTIQAIDQTAYNYRYPDHPDDETYGGHLEAIQKTFWIGGEMFYVNFKTVDDIGAVMVNARVEIRSAGVYITDNTTNTSGIANISLSAGSYNVTVYWQDVLVNETVNVVVDQDIPIGSAIVLNCSVYYPTYRVVDVAYENVMSANLYIGHPNSTLLTLITGADGTIGLDQIPGGEYGIRTEWLSKEVNTTSQNLTSNNEFLINASIYYLTVTTKDSLDAVVPDVHVIVEFNDTKRTADAQLTDNLGNMTARLPGTQSGFGYDLTCQWHGVYVGGAINVNLTQNDTINITLEIYYVDFHTVDSMGFDLEYTRLLAYTNETGGLANTAETDITGDATMRLPGGNHTVEAYWRGINVGTHYFEVNGSVLPEIITCQVYHVIFNLTDSRGIELENAQIVASHPVIGVLNSNITNSNGKAKTRLPGTTVDIDVQWRGVSVYSSSQLIDSNGELDITCGVYYLSVKAVDDMGDPLENARIEYLYGNSILASDITGEDGTTSESRLPGATLTIRAYWKDIKVYDEPYLLDSDGQENITTAVYHVDIEVVDSMGEIIPGATVTVSHDDALISTDLTDDNGMAFARLPGETHRFQVYWKGILIFDSEILINQSGKITLQADDVYHVTFQLLDSRSESVNGASITLEVSGVQLASGVSDENGMYSTRIPTPVDEAGEVKVTVYWKNIQVYDEFVQIDSNAFPASPKGLVVEVYYIDYTILDQRGLPIESSKITVTHSELPEGNDIIGDQLTDENGYTLFRLPGGTQTLYAYWKDIEINTTVNDLDADENITANGDVYYLDINVKDDEGAAIEYSLVRINYPGGESLYQADYTDAEGNLEFRIPASAWEMEVSWLNTVIYEGEFNVTNASESWHLDAQAKVYYFTVRTEDKEGALSDVQVIVQNGEYTWSGYTENGEYTFRLPARDDYTIKAGFKTTYMLTDVNLNQSKEITLQESGSETIGFESHPPAIYTTNLFFLILAFLILLIILAMVYRKTRAGGEGEPEGAEEKTFDADDAIKPIQVGVTTETVISPGEDALDEEVVEPAEPVDDEGDAEPIDEEADTSEFDEADEADEAVPEDKAVDDLSEEESITRN